MNKQDLTLNNRQSLICHKTQPNQTLCIYIYILTYTYIYIYIVRVCVGVCMRVISSAQNKGEKHECFSVSP